MKHHVSIKYQIIVKKKNKKGPHNKYVATRQ